MAKLYQKCGLCGGTGRTKAPAMVDGHDGYSGPLPPGSACPCASSKTPGWSEVGLTTGQVDQLVADRDRLLAAVADLVDKAREANANTCCRERVIVTEAVAAMGRRLLTGRSAEVDEARRRLAVPNPGG